MCLSLWLDRTLRAAVCLKPKPHPQGLVPAGFTPRLVPWLTNTCPRGKFAAWTDCRKKARALHKFSSPCVGHHGVIMWHETPGPWNGRAAATMYAELGKALRKTYGERRNFIVVEDGDTKGFQSNAGKAAKRRERITSMMLPPRSPGWMPLDFSLWDDIESRALAMRVREFEAVEAYKKRLAITARRLPARIVQNCLLRMKAKIDETAASRGRHTRVE